MHSHERYLDCTSLFKSFFYKSLLLKKEVMNLDICKYVFLGMVLLMAVLSDLRSEKINNSIIIFGIIGGLCNVFYKFSLQQVIYSVTGMFIPIIILFPLFYFHMFGAGDIKLLAVVGGLLGYKGVLFCIIVSIFTGAFISVFKMCKYQLFRERFAYFSQYMKIYFLTGKRIPYFDSSLSENAKVHFSIPILISVAGYFMTRWGGMFI